MYTVVSQLNIIICPSMGQVRIMGLVRDAVLSLPHGTGKNRGRVICLIVKCLFKVFKFFESKDSLFILKINFNFIVFKFMF